VTHSIEYRQRITGPEWLALRRRLLAAAGYRCQRCWDSGVTLQLHHKTYDRLGHEVDEDFEVLCIPCHKSADEERAEEVEARRYYARLNGWATKVYGEGWDRGGVDRTRQIAQEFAGWLDEHDR
jgi:5-methylcytosine-specific restriction endonuclease McrA